ncbi:MFS transporter [Nocardioides sp. CCNWLW239]|uniref:MFS transporter n=1 Tax=Nocardioides sp. CCNWLW239 TaxID=3128902 RepID=UPI003019E08B
MGLAHGRKMLLAMVCSAAVATIYVAQPVLPRIGQDVGVPESDLGWIVAAGQFGYLVGLAVLVPLGDMVDRRRLIGGQLLLAAVGLLVTAVAPGLWLLLIGLATTGLFAAVVQTAVAFAADLSTPAERGRTLGTVTSGVIVGILGARVLAGIVAGVWGWRSVYVTLMLLLVVLSIVVLKLLPADHRSDPRSYGDVLASLGRLFREPLFLSRGLIAFFLFASFGTLWSGLALPLEAEPWHLSTGEIGMFGIAGLVGAWGAARAGRWADAGRADLATGAALLLLALSWIASGQAMWSLWLVVVGVIVLDFSVQAAHVSNQSLLTAAFSDQTSSAIGGYMIFYSLGSVLGATATTSMFSTFGWTGSAVLGAGFALCGLLVWALSRGTVTGTPHDVAVHGSLLTGAGSRGGGARARSRARQRGA